MVVWLLGEDGRRLRLIDPFVPTFYVAAPRPLLVRVDRLLRQGFSRISIRPVERYELGASCPTPVLEIAVHSPALFPSVTNRLIQSCPDAQFFHVDLSLPQRYFYDRQTFSLAHCEVELTAQGLVRTIHALESPWDTDYALPPLAIMSCRRIASHPTRITAGATRLSYGSTGTNVCWKATMPH